MPTDNRTNEPTEGQVEEALFQAFKDWDESGDLFTVQARAVMSLFRGGAK